MINPAQVITWSGIIEQAQQPLPLTRLPFYINDEIIGSVTASDAALLSASIKNLTFKADTLQLKGDFQTTSALCADIALCLKQAGHIRAWRNELLPITGLPKTDEMFVFKHPLAVIERGAARRLGILTHAVHLTGQTPNGDVWLQRRALSKATDPGLLDTLAGGLLSYGDTLYTGVLRETYEEAGLQADQLLQLNAHGATLVQRSVAKGVMIELAWSYSAILHNQTTPKNLDGEVSEFCCMAPQNVYKAIQQGEVTLEASLAMGLAWSTITPDIPSSYQPTR